VPCHVIKYAALAEIKVYLKSLEPKSYFGHMQEQINSKSAEILGLGPQGQGQKMSVRGALAIFAPVCQKMNISTF